MIDDVGLPWSSSWSSGTNQSDAVDLLAGGDLVEARRACRRRSAARSPGRPRRRRARLPAGSRGAAWSATRVGAARRPGAGAGRAGPAADADVHGDRRASPQPGAAATAQHARRRPPPGGPGDAGAGGAGAQMWTTGQVRVRVMPSRFCTLATTSLPSSSTLRASARTITSYGPVTSSARVTPLTSAIARGDLGGLADVGLDQDVGLDHHRATPSGARMSRVPRATYRADPPWRTGRPVPDARRADLVGWAP